MSSDTELQQQQQQQQTTSTESSKKKMDVDKEGKTTATETECVVRPTFTVAGRRNPGSISYGDSVVVYASPSKIQFTIVEKGKTLVNEFGRFSHDDMVGLQWGIRVVSTTKKGFVHLLYPTPELWTRGLPHRTQILYMADISLISSFLDLRPGCKVVESGTGSGSFSHSIARSIAPKGHLYSFEFNAERFKLAKEEFVRHGFGEDLISVFHSDVCAKTNEPGNIELNTPGTGFWGFEGIANSVFLDLPSPWLAISNAKKLFVKGLPGKICCFSPCVEQVITTCGELERNGFTDIKMFEVLRQELDVRQHVAPKKIPFERRVGKPKEVQTETTDATETEKVDVESNKDIASRKRRRTDVTDPSEMITVAKVINSTAGHTSFLTFAVYNPELTDINALKTDNTTSDVKAAE